MVSMVSRVVFSQFTLRLKTNLRILCEKQQKQERCLSRKTSNREYRDSSRSRADNELALCASLFDCRQKRTCKTKR